MGSRGEGTLTVKRDVRACSFAAAEVVVLGMAPGARVAEALAIVVPGFTGTAHQPVRCRHPFGGS